MSNNKISVEKSVEIGIRHPAEGHTLLAKTLSGVMNSEQWINDEMKQQFCSMFLSNTIDHAIDREVDQDLLEKVKKISFIRGIRLLKRTPEAGLKVLVSLVTQEIENTQKLSVIERSEFYDEILFNLFPKFQESEEYALA